MATFAGLDASLSFPAGRGWKGGGGPGAAARGAGGPGGRAGGGGATLRRLCPRLPAEPRRREAAPRGARRPRLRNRPPLARPSAPVARPTPGGGLGAPWSPRPRALAQRVGKLRGPLPHTAAPSFSGRPPHPSLSPTLPSPGPPDRQAPESWRGASRIGRMYPQGRHPVSRGPGCGEVGDAGRPGTQTWASPPRPRFSPASPSSSRSWRSATASKKNSSFFRLSTTGKG